MIIDGAWLSTAILLVMTVGLVMFRYTARTHESNWPLVYYALAVGHLQLFEGGLEPNLVFAAIVAAMLLRFEFMSGWFLKVVQIAEYAFLALIGYRLFDLLFR